MATGSGVSGPKEVMWVMEDIGARDVIGVIEVMGVMEAMGVMEVMGIIDVIGWFIVICVMVAFIGLVVMGLEAMGLEVMGLGPIGAFIAAMLPMEGLELPIGWRGSPPLIGSSTIRRRL